MHPNESLVRHFYEAFQARDAAAMGACYHDEVVFDDPAFGELRGQEARDMWAMLCGRAADLAVLCDRADGGEERGSAHWLADYTFTRTGRKVHNDVSAQFAFRDGLIVRHHDDFSFWRWSRQALGPIGLLLGWTPLLRAKVRATARSGLAAYRAKKGG